MRTAAFALVSVAAGVLAALAWMAWQVDLPRVGPDVERLCVETMQLRPPDVSWVSSSREARVGDRPISTVTLGELRSLQGSVVRVAGVLNGEIEHVAVYPSRAAMQEQPWHAPRVALFTLWPGEPYVGTKGPVASDRCALMEARYASGPIDFGGFPGALSEVCRLDVCSTPHRPRARTAPAPPAPPEPPCTKPPTRPKRMGGDAALRALFVDFRKLYGSKEFTIGACVAHAQVNEKGGVDAVQVVRPRDADRRVATLLVRALREARYQPARACGRPVSFRVTVALVHCPVLAED